MFIKPTGQLLVATNGIDGLVDAEHDESHAKIVGEETEHVEEVPLFPIFAKYANAVVINYYSDLVSVEA